MLTMLSHDAESEFSVYSAHRRSAPPANDPDMRAGWLAYGMGVGHEIQESRRRGRFGDDD